MTNEEFEAFREVNRRRLANLDEAEVICEEQSFKRQIAKLLLAVEQNRLVLKDTQIRLTYLRSIKPESIIERANHGDLASE